MIPFEDTDFKYNLTIYVNVAQIIVTRGIFISYVAFPMFDNQIDWNSDSDIKIIPSYVRNYFNKILKLKAFI